MYKLMEDVRGLGLTANQRRSPAVLNDCECFFS